MKLYVKSFLQIVLAIVMAVVCVSCAEGAGDRSGSDITESAGGSESTEDGTSVNIGGNVPCTIHEGGYHSQGAGLLSYIGDGDPNKGAEMVEEWRAEMAPPDLSSGCSYSGDDNIRSFIEHFDIPREAYEEDCLFAYGNGGCPLAPDLVYSEDGDALLKYVSDVESRNAEERKQSYMIKLKHAIAKKYYGDYFSIGNIPEEERTEIESKLLRPGQVSMVELIKMFEVDRKTLEELYWSLTMANEEGLYDYNYDLVYNADGSVKDFEIDTSLSLYELDSMFAGVDNILMGE